MTDILKPWGYEKAASGTGTLADPWVPQVLSPVADLLTVGSAGADYSTIAAAKAAATRRSLIHVYPGSYSDSDLLTSYAYAITEATRTSNVSTITTSADHGFQAGDLVWINQSAAATVSFDGVWRINTVPTTTTFTFTQSAGNQAAVGAGGKAVGRQLFYFESGAVVRSTAVIFDSTSLNDVDGLSHAWVEIYGHGEFISTLSPVNIIADALTPGNVRFLLQCARMHSQDNASPALNIGGSASIFIVSFDDELRSDQYDAVTVESSVGRFELRGSRLIGGDNGIEINDDGTNPNSIIAEVSEIIGGAEAVKATSTASGSRVRVCARKISGVTAGCYLSTAAGCKVFVEADDITASAGPGVYNVGGSTAGYNLVKNARVGSTYNNAAGVSVKIDANATTNLFLQNCILPADNATGATSIAAAGAANCGILGIVAAKNAKHANVTIVAGGTLAVDSAVL